MHIAPSFYDGLGEASGFWGSLASALPALGQSAAQIITAVNAPRQIQGYTQSGIYPIGYNNGMPVYGSLPAGVTPSSPYALPSGMALPSGVTPTMQPYSMFPSTTQSSMLPVLMIGGAALALLLLMRK